MQSNRDQDMHEPRGGPVLAGTWRMVRRSLAQPYRAPTFLARYPAERVPEFDRRVAPALALCISAVVAVGLAASWLAYLWGGETHFTFGP